MTIYTISLPFDTLDVEADLTQASAPITLLDADDNAPMATPFQTADARHRPREMARLLIAWLGHDYWRDGDGDGRPDAEQIDDLILSVKES